MRILFIANGFPPVVGGSAIVYHNLCRHLGQEVLVLAPWRNYQDGQEFPGWRKVDGDSSIPTHRIELLRPLLRPDGTSRLHGLWLTATRDLGRLWRIRREVLATVRRFQPDVVCLGELYALHWVGRLLRRKMGLPVIHYVHGDEISYSFGSGPYAQGTRRALAEAEAVVTVSHVWREPLIRAGARPDRIEVIVNGVDTREFFPGPPDPELRARFGNRRVLFTATRLMERKGVDRTIEAMPAILRAVPDALYVIAGDGPYRATLEGIVARLGLQQAVMFAGPVAHTELCRYYRTCDLFLMPNRTLASGESEGLGLVFLEAGACGKAVISGKTGGVGEVVHDGENGVQVDGDSAEEIAAAVIRLLADSGLAAKMGARGRDLALSGSWEVKAAQFRELCARLASKRA